MAAGIPVLVSNVSSLPEVVQNAECSFDPLDPTELVKKLKAAAIDSRCFAAPLPPYLSEAAGIAAYLQVLKSVSVEK